MHKRTLSLLATLLAYPTFSYASALDDETHTSRQSSPATPTVEVEAPRQVPTNELLRDYVTRAMKTSNLCRHSDALTLVQEFLKAGGLHNEATHYVTAKSYSGLGDLENAAHHYEKFMSLAIPSNLSREFFHHVLNVVQELLKADGLHNKTTLYLTARSSEGLKNYRNAAHHYEKYISLVDPEHIAADVYLDAARMCYGHICSFTTSDKTRASSQYKKRASKYITRFWEAFAREGRPLTAHIHLRCAGVFTITEEFEKALFHWKSFRAMQEGEDLTGVHCHMGCILNYLGKFEEARYYFEEFHKATSCDTRDLYHVFGLIVSHLTL